MHYIRKMGERSESSENWVHGRKEGRPTQCTQLRMTCECCARISRRAASGGVLAEDRPAALSLEFAGRPTGPATTSSLVRSGSCPFSTKLAHLRCADLGGRGWVRWRRHPMLRPVSFHLVHWPLTVEPALLPTSTGWQQGAGCHGHRGVGPGGTVLHGATPRPAPTDD